MPIGIPVLEPAADGRIVYRDTIAKLSKYIPIKIQITFHRPENDVDFAIAEVTNFSLVSSKIAFIGEDKGINTVKLKQSVEKVSRTTEHIEGEVVGLDATIKIDFLKGKVLFKHQIITSKMSTEGDSGSLLMGLNGHAVELLVGTVTIIFFS